MLALSVLPIVGPITAAASDGGGVGAGEVDVISPGIKVIADGERMALSAKRGGEAVFEAADFESAAGVSVIDYITITSLPDTNDGRLQIGSLALSCGQSITRLNLSRMAFVPTGEEVENAEFSFSVNGSGYDYTCTVNFVDETNTAPTLATVTVAQNAETYSGMPTVGRLAAFDADGDRLWYTITEFPKHGSVILIDRETGSYIYTPKEGFSGKDSFSYTARDSHGDMADSDARVSVTVTRRNGREGFADLEGSVFESIAMRASASGIMGGTDVGGHRCFYPSEKVSRAEFLVCAMSAAGITELPKCERTVFADDDDISTAAKPYVAAAYALGICDGWIKENEQCFLPNEDISVAEAELIVSELLEISTTSASPVSTGSDSVPAWAEVAYCSMRAAGFVGIGVSGSARAGLDRLGCAELICAIVRYSASR